jgi:hypothetical protein
VTKRAGKVENSTRRIHFRVTPQEGGKIDGLAWYLGTTYSELFREYAEQLRGALVVQGRRPPLSAPEDTTAPRRRVQIQVSVQVEEVD